ncbi:hypothetical protein VTP01DRAFT_4432 [Rhizomucor pusillus]|uniref:uncharacterized protein n=1 Tax=Rhizomucor pusillus TaxID=4840 RepID=UPI0037438EC7
MKKDVFAQDTPPKTPTEQMDETPRTSACRQQIASMGLRSQSGSSAPRVYTRVYTSGLELPEIPEEETPHPNLSMVLSMDDSKISIDREVPKKGADSQPTVFHSDESSDDDHSAAGSYSPSSIPSQSVDIDALFDEEHKLEVPPLQIGATNATSSPNTRKSSDVKGKQRMRSIDSLASIEDDSHLNRSFSWNNIYHDNNANPASKDKRDSKEEEEADKENRPPSSGKKRPAVPNVIVLPIRRPLATIQLNDSYHPNVPPKKKQNSGRPDYARLLADTGLVFPSTHSTASSSTRPRPRPTASSSSSSSSSSSASLPQRPRDLPFGFSPPKPKGKGKAKATKNVNNNNNDNNK